MVTTQQLAEALLAVFEGERLYAYKDSGGIWTIGLGHTGPVDDVAIYAGMVITPAKAVQLLSEDDAPLFSLVTSFHPLKAACYVSFGINCGKTALNKVISGQDTIDNPVHTTDSKGTVLPGLVSRRKLESLLIQISDQV